LNRGWTTSRLVGYMESHDEERLMFDCINYGNTQNPAYRLKEPSTALKRMELAANLFIPVPGPKMIWMFGELGYDYSINFNGRIGNKPIRWDYFTESQRNRLYQVYAALNKLKITQEAFSSENYLTDFSDTIKRLQINDPALNVTILGNFGIRSSSVIPHFQHTGWWYEYWSGDSVQITLPDNPITLNPGEYRLYTDVHLSTPDIISGTSPEPALNNGISFTIWPNPAREELQVAIPEVPGRELVIRISDLAGRTLTTQRNAQLIPGQTLVIDTGFLSPGIYFIRLESGNLRTVRKFVKE